MNFSMKRMMNNLPMFPIKTNHCRLKVNILSDDDDSNDHYHSLEKYICPEIFTDEPTEEDRASIFQAHCTRVEHECQVGK